MTTIVLVHGLWADGSSWSRVIPILLDGGHDVTAVQLPLTSLDDDVQVARRALQRSDEPVVAVGHSYGGAVVTGAATELPQVRALVYVAAYAPDEGESVNDVNERFPTPPAGEAIRTDDAGYLSIDPAAFPAVFAADLDPADARVLAAVQGPASYRCAITPSGKPAWRQVPSWYQVSNDDKTIPPDAERWMAERMGATTITLDSSHASLLSHPAEVAALIVDAARGAG